MSYFEQTLVKKVLLGTLSCIVEVTSVKSVHKVWHYCNECCQRQALLKLYVVTLLKWECRTLLWEEFSNIDTIEVRGSDTSKGVLTGTYTIAVRVSNTIAVRGLDTLAVSGFALYQWECLPQEECQCHHGEADAGRLRSLCSRWVKQLQNVRFPGIPPKPLKNIFQYLKGNLAKQVSELCTPCLFLSS